MTLFLKRGILDSQRNPSDICLLKSVTETISRNPNCLKTFFLKVNICKLSFFHLIIWVRFPCVHLKDKIFILNNLFCLFVFLWFLRNLKKFLSIWMVIIYLERTRVNPDRNIFSINVELTSTFSLYWGLVHYHHRILKVDQILKNGCTFS